MGKDVTTLEAILAPSIIALGYEFVGCVYMSGGRNASLRVYIDSESGITITDCERVSRQLSAVLDVEDPIRGAYRLEVSSPGLDRPLFKLAHFQRFIGQVVNIRLHMPVVNRRNLKGILISAVDEENIVVEVEQQKITVTLDNIAKANLYSK